jgi:hypothetical protein
LSACGSSKSASPAPSTGTSVAMSGLVELVASDPLRHDYDFSRADFGGVIQDNTIKNAGAEIDFANYYKGDFTVGIEGGDVGRIFDFGTDAPLATTLGVEETAGSGQGFAHLTAASLSKMGDAANVLDSLNGPDHVPVALGHIYMLRIVNLSLNIDRLVKLLVTEQGDDKVAFEWVRLQ